MATALKRVSHGSIAQHMGIKLFEFVKNKAEGEKVPFARVGGFITRTKNVTTTYGDSTQFGGDIRAQAVHPVTGEVHEFYGTVAYLPRQGDDLLNNAWNGRPTGTKEMTFLIDIDMHKIVQKDGTEKYEFTCQPRVEAPVTDRMTALFGQAPKLALAAPVAATAAPAPAVKAAPAAPAKGGTKKK